MSEVILGNGVSVQLLDNVSCRADPVRMARSIRIQAAGAFYHVMARGNRIRQTEHRVEALASIRAVGIGYGSDE